MNNFKSRRQPFFGRKRDIFYEEVERAIRPESIHSLLDIGCGSDSPIQFFKHRPALTVGVDGFQPSIEKSKKKNIHDQYECIHLMDIDTVFSPKSFDCVLSIDVIEHFEKRQGVELLKKMEDVASKSVVLVTPNGFLPQEAHSGNAYQKHLSGWNVEEMQRNGYEVYGLNGWKPLLGEYAQPKLKPARLWRMLSRLSQPFVFNHPEKAFHLLCIKNL